MRTMANAVVCLFLGASLSASAGEDGAFPPLPSVKVGPHEFRISTVKRGLSMLPTDPPPPVAPPARLPDELLAGRRGGLGGTGALLGGDGVGGDGGGIGGGIGGGGALPPPQLPPPRVDPGDRGSKVGLKQGLEGDAARAQETFAALFPKLDPLPPDREAHFDWLPHYEDHPVWKIGWWAVVEKVEPDRGDAWTVRVRLYPRLRSRVFKTLILDYVEETYQVEGETIRLIDSDAKTPKPRHQGFPVHF